MKENIFTVVIFILLSSLVIAAVIFKFWLIGSLGTSGVKALTENCGKSYRIERFVSGDWFCLEAK